MLPITFPYLPCTPDSISLTAFYLASSGESQHLYQLMRDSELSQADLSMKTIKKGRKGPVFSGSRQGGVLGFKAVQDAIG